MPRWPEGYISKRTCPKCGGPKDFNAAACRGCAPHARPLAGRRGPEHPAWRGGRAIDQDGYVRLYLPDYEYRRKTPYVFEHVVVMERHLERRLAPDETVHHIDHDRQNNALDNLEVKLRGAHSSHHRKLDIAGRQRDARGRFAPGGDVDV